MKNSRLTISAVIALLCCCCCISKVETPQGVELTKVKLVLKSPLVCKPGQTITCGFAEGLGPMSTDEVVLRRDSREDVVIPISSLEKSTFKYVLPKQFEYGTYSFCLRRLGVLRGFGKVKYAATDSPEPEVPVGPEPGSTVWGVVSCGGNGISGVVVSDGFEVVCTDSRGVYQIKSAKRNGYVFISIPSGYEVASNGVLPLFHKQLQKSPDVCEQVDFTLFESGDQTRHTMLYFGDMHLANRTKDRTQFKTFTDEINSYLKNHQGEKVYALTLGDMTWDQFWYKNLYCFDQYLSDVGAIKGLQIFHTIGNHDHDMDATGDFDTVIRYRDEICPTNYSFNIGKIHYVVLDDIECTNPVASRTDASYRSYRNNLVEEALSWLRKDLSFVPKGSQVVVTMHAPLFNKEGNYSLANGQTLAVILYDYDATVVTGHSHVVYNIKSPSVREYNSGAVCAAWWWAGKYCPSFNIGTDGAPNGYRIMSVNGTVQESFYKGIGRPDDYQFRAYDRNSICLTGENVNLDATSAAVLYAEDYGGYHYSSSANHILVNVWDWDPSWKVEASENGKALDVTRLTKSYDPAFLIAYTIPRLTENSTSVSWHQSETNHIFRIQATSPTSTVDIKVTDDEGRVYTEKMQRPRAFTVDTYK